jgi:hypothetical protein
MAEIPTPALAVPYAAPKQVNTMAAVQPIAPKNGYQEKTSACFMPILPVSIAFFQKAERLFQI